MSPRPQFETDTTDLPSEQARGSRGRAAGTLARFLTVAVAFTGVSLAWATPSGAAKPIRTSSSLQAGFETGLTEFNQVQANAGTFTRVSELAYSGSYSLKATIDGTSAAAYSRGLFEGSWGTGQSIVYRASFYLPAGFLANVKAQTDLMRLDNYPDNPTTTERVGVSIFSGDKRLHLVRNKLGVEQVSLLGPHAIFDGRWNVIEVRQTLSSINGVASNAMYLNGVLLGTSTAANSYGNAYKRIRYGIVAVGPMQTTPQTLYLDGASIQG